MILVEGPDGAGKTTLVKHLAEEFGFTIGERGVADRDKLYTVTRSDTYNALSQAVKGDAQARVWDRLFYSEMVYAPVVGRKCEFSHYERGFVCEVLEALQCPVILCVPPLEVVEANITEAKQMAGVNENIRAIYQHYNTGVNAGGLMSLRWPDNTVRYDYTGQLSHSSDFPYVSLPAIHVMVDSYLISRKEREVNAELPSVD